MTDKLRGLVSFSRVATAIYFRRAYFLPLAPTTK